MTNSFDRSRVPQGVPSGGQFTSAQRSESNVSLRPTASSYQPTPAPVPEPAPKGRTSSSENPEMELAVDFADVSEKFKAAKSAASGLFKRFRGR